MTKWLLWAGTGLLAVAAGLAWWINQERRSDAFDCSMRDFRMDAVNVGGCPTTSWGPALVVAVLAGLVFVFAGVSSSRAGRP
jgi:hypothetical protein